LQLESNDAFSNDAGTQDERMTSSSSLQSKFIQAVSNANFDPDVPLPDDGESCRDLFAINNVAKPGEHLTTGCLHVFADDVLAMRLPFRSAALVREASAAGTRKNRSRGRGRRTSAEAFAEEVLAEGTRTRVGPSVKRLNARTANEDHSDVSIPRCSANLAG